MRFDTAQAAFSYYILHVAAEGGWGSPWNWPYQDKMNTTARANDIVHKISTEDRDSLFSLPLCILPLETSGLATARMIKNARLESMVELFSGKKTGSGQLAVRDLPHEFGLAQGDAHPDMKIFRKLEKLQSYDVYSLRLTLRELEINVDDVDALRLSDEKVKELTKYMVAFTHPLIQEIYGDSTEGEINNFEDILRLFRQPDATKALNRLKEMSAKLDIPPTQVPVFLEDYGDIFMSLSYYRQCLDQIEPTIGDFLDAVKDLRTGYQYRGDRGLQDVTREMESVLNDAMAGLNGRFENFDRATNGLWQNISAERFRKVEKLIRDFHTTNGGVLCSLWVKMSAWTHAFPNRGAGSPAKLAEFIQTELKHGLTKIRDLERSAPRIASI